MDNIIFKAEALKIIGESMPTHLAFTINPCMEIRHWPIAFKEPGIVPIYKKGNEEDISYNEFSQGFRKDYKKRLIAYLTRYNLISEKQFDFKENKSTDAIDAI